jgi:hypothetical protein
VFTAGFLRHRRLGFFEDFFEDGLVGEIVVDQPHRGDLVLRLDGAPDAGTQDFGFECGGHD